MRPTLRPTARVWLAALALLLQAGYAQPPGPSFDGVAAVSEGERVALRWSLPGDVFPSGGFVVRAVAPDGTERTFPVASPAPRALALVDADTYDAIEELFDPTLAPVDDDEALALAFLRAAFALEAAADPDLARALGVLSVVDELPVGERWRFEVATAAGVRVGSAELVVGGTPPLEPPDGLAVEPTVDGVGLRWRAADEATLVFGYRVEVRGAGGAFVDLGSGWLTPPEPDEAAPDPFWFVDDTPYPVGLEVVYRVVGRDLFGRETPPSASVALVIPDPLAFPRGLVVDAQSGDRTVTLRWAIEPDPRVVAVGVVRAEHPDDPPVLVSPLFAASVDTWTDEGLRGGRDYLYAIAAYTEEGLASVGPAWVQRALNPHPPGAPLAPVATPGTDGVSLRWAAPADDDVGRYQVYGGRPGTPFEAMTLVAETTATELHVPVPENTLFDLALRVRAVNTSDVAGDPSVEVVARLLDETPPSAPLWADVQGVERGVALRWLLDLDPDVVALRLERADGVAVLDGALVDAAGAALGDAAFATLAAALAPDVTSFLDADVDAGRLYAYRLVAIDASGNASPPSEARAAAAWDLRAPAAPRGLRAALEGGGAALTWDADPSAAGWVVSRWLGNGFVEVSDLLEAPAFVDARGAAGDRYRVVAVSPSGLLGAGAEVTVPAGD